MSQFAQDPENSGLNLMKLDIVTHVCNPCTLETGEPGVQSHSLIQSELQARWSPVKECVPGKTTSRFWFDSVAQAGLDFAILLLLLPK